MFLLILFLLEQPVVTSSVVTSSKCIIQRHHSTSKSDKFELPNSWCKTDKNLCEGFKASLDQRSSSTYTCLCSCSVEGSATFGIKKGSWQCVDNKEIREQELHDCKRINFMNEKDSDPLEILKIQNTRTLNISSSIECSENSTGVSYQTCDGGWSTLKNAAAWGFQVTHTSANSPAVYILKLNKASNSQPLIIKGRVVKLVIPCGTTKFCLLFKVAGNTECPISNPGTTLKPSRTTSSGTTSSRTTSSTTHPLTGTSVSHWYRTKQSTASPTTTAIGMNGKGSHEIPIALIAGSVGSAVVVLVVLAVIGSLFCLKRKTRKSSNHWEFPKNTATKTVDTSGQYSVALQTEAYESLAPTQDGFPREVYVSRYKVPDKNNISVELSKRDLSAGFDPHFTAKEQTEKPDYDYAEARVLHRNVLESIELREAVRKVPAENTVRCYHVLEGVERSTSKSQKEACVTPEDNTPCVLEGPKTLDSQDNLHKGGNETADMVPYDILEEPICEDPNSDVEKDPIDGALAKDAYYHVLEEAVGTSNSQGDRCYKELQTDGTVYSAYQPLHKYAYVDAGKIQYNKTT